MAQTKLATEAIQELLLDEKLSTINLDGEKEPFILTDDEVGIVKRNYIDQLKHHKAWKLSDAGASQAVIIDKINKTDWSLVDFTEAIEYANMCKQAKLQWEQTGILTREKEIADRARMVEICNAKYMYNVMAHTSLYEYGKKLVTNESNKELIKALCFFLSEDERFKTELKFDPNKGLWIFGDVGVGKTHLVSCVAKNELNPITLSSMIEITNELKQYGKFSFLPGKKIYIDDVGTEQPLVNFYGTKLTFFKSFIENVSYKKEGFNRMIVSTNLSFAEIEQAYGFRVRDRVPEMFNVLFITGESFRRK